MRIGVVVESFPVVSETFVIDQVADLIDRGLDVEIFAFAKGARSNISPRFHAYSMSERVRYLDMPGSKIARRLRALPLLARSLRKPKALLRMARARRFAPEVAWPLRLLYWCGPFIGRPCDVYHCHFGPSGERFALIREILGIRAPFLTSFYGYDASMVFRNESNPYPRLRRDCPLFIAMSVNMRQRLIDHGFPAERIRVLPVGVDVSRYHFEERADHDGAIRILSVGRMVEKKGFDDLLAALAIVRQRSTRPVHCTIIGDGPLRDMMETRAREMRLDDVIAFEGARPVDYVVSAFRSTDFFVQASKTASNGDME